MKDLQTQLKRIRSDAAECLMLGNLVNEERRLLFVRIAEHLNSLALELETETASTIVDPEPAAPPPPPLQVPSPPLQVPWPPEQAEPVSDERRPSIDQTTKRSWHRLAWFGLLISVVAAGAYGATHRTELQTLSPAKFISKIGPAALDPGRDDLTRLLSEERQERNALMERLTGLVSRLDNVTTELDALKKTLGAHMAVPSIAPSPGSRPDRLLERDAPVSPEAGRSTGTSPGGSETEAPAEAAPAPAAPATTSPAADAADRVGTIPPTQADLDSRRPTIGPAGCTRFHSFDPVTGTYVTFDGRRRQCR